MGQAPSTPEGGADAAPAAGSVAERARSECATPANAAASRANPTAPAPKGRASGQAGGSADCRASPVGVAFSASSQPHTPVQSKASPLPDLQGATLTADIKSRVVPSRDDGTPPGSVPATTPQRLQHRAKTQSLSKELSRMKLAGDDEHSPRHLFAATDVDKSGMICEEEFLRLHTLIVEHTREQMRAENELKTEVDTHRRDKKRLALVVATLVLLLSISIVGSFAASLAASELAKETSVDSSTGAIMVKGGSRPATMENPHFTVASAVDAWNASGNASENASNATTRRALEALEAGDSQMVLVEPNGGTMVQVAPLTGAGNELVAPSGEPVRTDANIKEEDFDNGLGSYLEKTPAELNAVLSLSVEYTMGATARLPITSWERRVVTITDFYDTDDLAQPIDDGASPVNFSSVNASYAYTEAFMDELLSDLDANGFTPPLPPGLPPPSPAPALPPPPLPETVWELLLLRTAHPRFTGVFIMQAQGEEATTELLVAGSEEEAKVNDLMYLESVKHLFNETSDETDSEVSAEDDSGVDSPGRQIRRRLGSRRRRRLLFKKARQKIKNAVSKAVSTVAAPAKKAYETVKKGVETAAETVGSAIQSAYDATIGAVTNIKQKVEDLIQAVGQLFQTVASFVTDFAAKVADFFEGFNLDGLLSMITSGMDALTSPDGICFNKDPDEDSDPADDTTLVGINGSLYDTTAANVTMAPFQLTTCVKLQPELRFNQAAAQALLDFFENNPIVSAIRDVVEAIMRPIQTVVNTIKAAVDWIKDKVSLIGRRLDEMDAEQLDVREAERRLQEALIEEARHDELERHVRRQMQQVEDAMVDLNTPNAHQRAKVDVDEEMTRRFEIQTAPRMRQLMEDDVPILELSTKLTVKFDISQKFQVSIAPFQDLWVQPDTSIRTLDDFDFSLAKIATQAKKKELNLKPWLQPEYDKDETIPLFLGLKAFFRVKFRTKLLNSMKIDSIDGARALLHLKGRGMTFSVDPFAYSYSEPPIEFNIGDWTSSEFKAGGRASIHIHFQYEIYAGIQVSICFLSTICGDVRAEGGWQAGAGTSLAIVGTDTSFELRSPLTNYALYNADHRSQINETLQSLNGGLALVGGFYFFATLPYLSITWAAQIKIAAKLSIVATDRNVIYEYGGAQECTGANYDAANKTCKSPKTLKDTLGDQGWAHPHGPMLFRTGWVFAVGGVGSSPNDVETAPNMWDTQQLTSALPDLCFNSCNSAGDGVCDDGGLSSRASACQLGYDCDDCGPRSLASYTPSPPPPMPPSPPPPPSPCPPRAASGTSCTVNRLGGSGRYGYLPRACVRRSTTVFVVVYRGGTCADEFWQGYVRIYSWRSYDMVLRTSGRTYNQWQVGDEIVISPRSSG